ncbi:PREDICTED: c-X-C motif chemokine 6 [Chrysochloris asiatica]|uniref:C-X-C motif chemokine n=1 Tax=Chrysochloris asiatica TaxID=185453 RepID=A0A9B0WWU2_CHRAS|nr:PREDICTED: c-X-C motif chemokine 6 [Chrysochloris asiatica]
MSFWSNRSARNSRPSSSLYLQLVLLLLLLLTPPEPLVKAGPVATVVRELRCMCLQYSNRFHLKTMRNLKVIAAGPQCPKVEIIAYLKNGNEVCLNPDAPVIKKVIQRLLSSLTVSVLFLIMEPMQMTVIAANCNSNCHDACSSSSSRSTDSDIYT